MSRTVTLRRYREHIYAEFGAVPRTVGNVTPSAWISGWEWSSLESQGVVYTDGRTGRAIAEQAMIAALAREGFTVDPGAEPRQQAVACPSCGTSGQRGCQICGGTGRVWPEGGVTYHVAG